MQIPVFFSCLVIFIAWLNYKTRKTDKLNKNNQEAFWQTERKANSVRKVDISDLTTFDYITIPISAFPMEDLEDSSLNYYRDIISKLSQTKILNLTGLSNTELKLKYGTANIHSLMEYDNNYTLLVSTLQKWSEGLYANSLHDEAISVLEFAVSCHTEVGNSYKLLAKLYKENSMTRSIDSLIDSVSKTNITRKDSLIKELNHIKNSSS